MMRSIAVLSVALALTAACSRSQPEQTGGSSAAPAASSASSAQAPAAQPSAAVPAPGAATQSAGAAPAAPPAAPQPAAAQPSEPSRPAAAAAPAPGAPATPVVREVVIPASTVLSVTLESTLASDVSKVEDPVRGTLAKPVVLSGRTVAPAGSEVVGSVLEVRRSGRVKGRASIAFQFERLVVNGESYDIRTARIERLAEVKRSEDVKKGGIGAAAGAVIGALAGGKKGAVVGGAVGGTGAVLATRGEEVHLSPGTLVSARLTDAVAIRTSAVEQ